MSHARDRLSQSPRPPAAEEAAMRVSTLNSRDSRQRNVMANTADARIRGHALNSQRVSQAIRDGKSPQRPARKHDPRSK